MLLAETVYKNGLRFYICNIHNINKVQSNKTDYTMTIVHETNDIIYIEGDKSML